MEKIKHLSLRIDEDMLKNLNWFVLMKDARQIAGFLYIFEMRLRSMKMFMVK